MKQLVLIFLLFFLVSCGTTTIKQTDSTALYEVLTQQSNGGASIRFYEILTEENEIKMLLTDKNLKNKIVADDIIKSNFILINLGEKNRIGYKVQLESVIETDTQILIQVKELEPISDSIPTQDFVTPYCIVKINSKKQIVFQ